MNYIKKQNLYQKKDFKKIEKQLKKEFIEPNQKFIFSLNLGVYVADLYNYVYDYLNIYNFEKNILIQIRDQFGAEYGTIVDHFGHFTSLFYFKNKTILIFLFFNNSNLYISRNSSNPSHIEYYFSKYIKIYKKYENQIMELENELSSIDMDEIYEYNENGKKVFENEFWKRKIIYEHPMYLSFLFKDND